MKSITISKNIEIIGGYAFSGCINLKDIYCLTEIPPTTDYEDSPFEGLELTSITLHTPDIYDDIYKHMPPWDKFGTFKIIEK